MTDKETTGKELWNFLVERDSFEANEKLKTWCFPLNSVTSNTYETNTTEEPKIKEELKMSKRDAFELEQKRICENAIINIGPDSYCNYHLRKLQIDRKGLKSYDGYNYRFYTDTINFKAGVNLLFGGNGQGKSSLIEYLRALASVRDPLGSYKGIFRYCKLIKVEGELKSYSFVNSEDNGTYFDGNTLDENKYEFGLIRKMQSTMRSEGQNVMQSMTDFLYALDHLDKDNKAVVFIDELDSGLDVCMCRYLVKRLKKVIKEKPNLQFFIAFNQYEISKLDSQWLNVCTGELEDCPKTYEEYYKRVSINKQIFNRRVDREVKK